MRKPAIAGLCAERRETLLTARRPAFTAIARLATLEATPLLLPRLAASLVAAERALALRSACLFRLLRQRHTGFRAERIVDCRHALAGRTLDVAQIGALVATAERNRDTRGAGTRRAADAVHIALRHIRQVVIDHMGHA